MPSAKATTDHDTIRKWVEQRGGHPAHVKRTGRNRNDAGLLRIDYPGFSGEETLEAIEWDDFFKAFDKNKLAFLYQGGRSRFSKLVERDTVKDSLKGSAAITKPRNRATANPRTRAKRT